MINPNPSNDDFDLYADLERRRNALAREQEYSSPPLNGSIEHLEAYIEQRALDSNEISNLNNDGGRRGLHQRMARFGLTNDFAREQVGNAGREEEFYANPEGTMDRFEQEFNKFQLENEILLRELDEAAQKYGGAPSYQKLAKRLNSVAKESINNAAVKEIVNSIANIIKTSNSPSHIAYRILPEVSIDAMSSRHLKADSISKAAEVFESLTNPQMITEDKFDQKIFSIIASGLKVLSNSPLYRMGVSKYSTEKKEVLQVINHFKKNMMEDKENLKNNIEPKWNTLGYDFKKDRK